MKPVYTVVTANGKPAVLLNLYRQPDSNTVAVADAGLQRNGPDPAIAAAGVNLVQPFYDQSQLVRDSIKSVRDAILIGLVLAASSWFCFCGTGAVRLSPGLLFRQPSPSLLSRFACLGESFNLMTLGGLAAAVGLVIDDAIVVVENIVLHRDAGQSRSKAIRSAIREIRVPLVGSTVTPIVVFLPLITITGVTGTFFRALAITVGVALLTSLALALTWTPSLSHLLLRGKRGNRREATPGTDSRARADNGIDGPSSRGSTSARSRGPGPALCAVRRVRFVSRRFVLLLPGSGNRLTARHG